MVLGLVLGVAVLAGVAWLAWTIVQEYRGDRVPALLYHRFLAGADLERARSAREDLSYVTEAGAFSAQMEHLRAAGYTTLSIDEFLAFREGTSGLPPRPILITCDDGFESVYRHAYPIWKRLGMKATIFVTPDRSSENFRQFARFDAPLSDDQMITMSRNGVAIESHGMTHRYLSELPPQVVRWELGESRARLGRLTGRSVRFLAVPSGAYDRRVRALARQAGYEAVFCMRHGTNSRSSDRYALRRLTVGAGFTLADFQRLLTPWTACELRLVNACHNLMRVTLGSRRLDALHAILNRTGLRVWLRPGRLRFVLWAGGLGALTALAAALLLCR